MKNSKLLCVVMSELNSKRFKRYKISEYFSDSNVINISI